MTSRCLTWATRLIEVPFYETPKTIGRRAMLEKKSLRFGVGHVDMQVPEGAESVPWSTEEKCELVIKPSKSLVCRS